MCFTREMFPMVPLRWPLYDPAGGAGFLEAFGDTDTPSASYDFYKWHGLNGQRKTQCSAKV